MSRWTIELENLKDLINAMGIVGTAMVDRWSWGLLRHTSSVLLDQQAPAAVRNAVCEAIEAMKGTGFRICMCGVRLVPSVGNVTLSNYQVIKQSPNNKLRKRYHSTSLEYKFHVLDDLN
jgi:Co/Zn/Cd efflux system component